MKLTIDSVAIIPSPTPTPTPTPTPSEGFMPPAYSDIVISDSPIHYWRMEEFDGGEVKDQIGTNHLTPFDTGTAGSVTITPSGISGSGALIQLDDPSNYSIDPDNNGFTLANAIDTSTFVNGYTVEGWIKIPDGVTWEAIYSILGDSDPQGYGLEIYNDYSGPQMYYYVWGPLDSTDTYYINKFENIGNWWHIAYTVDSSNNCVLYFNGQAVIQGTYSYKPNFTFVGTDGGKHRNNCTIDEIAVYDYVLSPAQILSHYAALEEFAVIPPAPSPTPSLATPEPTPSPSTGYIATDFVQESTLLSCAAASIASYEAEFYDADDNYVGYVQTDDITARSLFFTSGYTGISSENTVVVYGQQDSTFEFIYPTASPSEEQSVSLLMNLDIAEGQEYRIMRYTAYGSSYDFFNTVNIINFPGIGYVVSHHHEDYELNESSVYNFALSDFIPQNQQTENMVLFTFVKVVDTENLVTYVEMYANGIKMPIPRYDAAYEEALELELFTLVDVRGGHPGGGYTVIGDFRVYNSSLTEKQVYDTYLTLYPTGLPLVPDIELPVYVEPEILPGFTHTRLDEESIIDTESEQSVYYGYQYFDAKYVPQLDKFVSLLGLSRYSYPVELLEPGREHIPFTFYYGDATQYEPNYPTRQPAPAFLDPQNRMSLVNVDNDNIIDQPQELPILAPFPTPSLSIFDDGLGNVTVSPVGQKMEIPVGAKFVSKLQDGPPVSQYVQPTPTPTPTISLTPEVTPTMTATPEVTPTPSPAPALPEGVFSVGYDDAGQIGDGAGVSPTGQFHNVMSWSETGDISSFVNLDSETTVAMIVDGALFSWGENNTGSTGTGSLTGNVFTATNIGGAEPSWDMVVGGERERFAIAGGKLYAWGLNTNGRLGLGDSTNRATPTQIGTDTDWSYVSTAGYFTYAMKTDGTLWSWGLNTSGQLGQGDTTPRDVPTQVGTSADWVKVIANNYNASVYAINSSGELYVCGNNFNGTLGLGDSGSGTNRTLLTRVGTRTDWQDVYPGVYSSAIIGRTADGIYSWGRGGSYGMLGISALNSVNEPTLVSNITDFTKIISNQEIFLALRANGEVYGWGYNVDYTLSPTGAAFNAIVETPTILSFPEPIVDIMCQTFHPMVYATSQNKLYAWGENGVSGQARYAPGLPLIVSDATVLLDYTPLNKSPILVAQTSNSATFATKII